MPDRVAYGEDTLLAGIRSRFVPGVNGLTMHILESGFDGSDRPLLLLLHGFPELAYSWRKLMLPLAEAGFHVVAPDQRGYGRTLGWDPAYDGDWRASRQTNIVRDALCLTWALGYESVAGLIGHDFGAIAAAHAAFMRPDVFRRVAIMSAPFPGTPAVPVGMPAAPAVDMAAALAALPRPRKHYHHYYATPQADPEMRRPPQGMHAFLRAYFHHKSADWADNKPYRLAGWTAEALAAMPTYYIMDLACSMPETVAKEMPSAAEIAACRWLSEAELAVYAHEYARTGFQGGLNWYRCRLDPAVAAEMTLFAGRTIDVPALFISGRSDWGVYQTPGAVEAMQEKACTRFMGCHLLDGAGHWVQQEQPEAVTRLLLEFLKTPE